MANSWTTAERNAFDYLLAQLGDTENTTAFLGEFPSAFADDSLTYLWTFHIDGGGDVDDVGAGDDYCGLNANAMFEGIFETRETAQQYGVAVKNLFPAASGTVAGLYDWRLTAEPSLARAVVRRDPDQTNGGEVRVWKLEIPMACVVVAS